MFIQLKIESGIEVWFNVKNILSFIELKGGRYCRMRLLNGEELVVEGNADVMINKIKEVTKWK